MYQPSDKMCTLLLSDGLSERDERQRLQIISRFGLPLGVGDQTVKEVCNSCGVDTTTFLCILNNQSQEDIDIPTLNLYLKNAHTYFLDFALPRIRQALIEAVHSSQIPNHIPKLIVRFFDEYADEIRTHISHENESIYPGHAEDDRHIAAKLTELKNLIIKYYPWRAPNPLLYSVLDDICEFEQELQLHCNIEDDILLPALKKTQKKRPSHTEKDKKQEELSEREKQVIIELVNGLSNKEIADRLCISTHTVISHRKNIARKLNIHSTAGLTIYAIVNNLVKVNS